MKPQFAKPIAVAVAWATGIACSFLLILVFSFIVDYVVGPRGFRMDAQIGAAVAFSSGIISGRMMYHHLHDRLTAPEPLLPHEETGSNMDLYKKSLLTMLIWTAMAALLLGYAVYSRYAD